MQAAFYEHFNGLAAAYGLQAKFLPKTKEKQEFLSKIEQEAKKPKSERSHNFYTRQVEKLEQELTQKKEELTEQKIVDHYGCTPEEAREAMDYVAEFNSDYAEKDD